MTASPARMTIECPAEGCGHHFADRNCASLIAALGADTAALEVNPRQESATSCPACGRAVEFGLLLLDDDGVWRVSRHAGHADDVTVMAPPGGGVSYEALGEEGPGAGGSESGAHPAPATTANGLKLRERALAVLEGRAADVSPGARRDAVEMAVGAGVLHADELVLASAWLERRPR